MMDQKPKKPFSAPKKLSSAVLDLKFMKKSKEKARIADADEQQQLLYADQLLALNNPSTDKVVLVGSHYDLMKYLPCRLSFGGMEPSIEKMNAEKLTGLYEVPKEVEPKEEEEDVDVTKEEMASHFASVHKKYENFNGKARDNRGNNFKRKSGELEEHTYENFKGKSRHNRGNNFKRKSGELEEPTYNSDEDIAHETKTKPPRRKKRSLLNAFTKPDQC